jgi:hypothetical protein
MRIILLLVAFAGCGCVRSEFVRTRATPAGAPRPADAVEVFLLERPTRPFTEVGFVEVHATDESADAGDLMAELRTRAGAEGCDAVAFLGDNDRISSSSATSGYRAVCLVYIAPTGVPPSP